METVLRIVHLSDLHLTADIGEKRKEDNKRGMNANLQLILKQRAVQQVDLVLVTGDITDRGEMAAWKVFWTEATNASLDLRKVLAIHGNHDAACLGYRRMKPKKEHLAVMEAGLKMGDQRCDFPYLRRFCNDRIGVFCLDSVNSGNFNVLDNAVGRLGFDQLYNLGKLIRSNDSILAHRTGKFPPALRRPNLIP